MKIRSVRARLTLWNVGVLAFIMAGSAVTLHYLVRLNLLSSIDGQLGRRFDWENGINARGLSEPFRPPPVLTPVERKRLEERRRKDRRERPPETPEARFIRESLSPAIFDLQGRSRNFFSTSAPWSRDAYLRSKKGEFVHQSITLRGAPFRVLSYPVFWDGKRVGVIQLIAPLRDFEQMMRNLDRTLLMLLLPSLLVAGLSGAFLTDRSLRPVHQFSEATAMLAANDLSYRLHVEGTDEFSGLAAQFNRMSERLETAFHNMESANHNLETANADLKAAYERQRRFTADASHELRTPLTAIKANTSMALAEDGSAESYRESMLVMDAAATRMSRIVNDLLLLARSDNDELRLKAEPVSVIGVIDRAVSETNRKRRQNPIHAHLPEADLHIIGDAHHLERLLLNLLENSVRHTPPEGAITVSAERQDRFVVIKVNDTGRGIPPEHLPHVFERFYRVDDARSREAGGAGLGLSICQSIALGHGGSIEIDSKPGSGTTVRVLLPVSHTPDVQTTLTREAQAVTV